MCGCAALHGCGCTDAMHWLDSHAALSALSVQVCKSMRLLCSVFFRFVCVRAALKMDAEKQECCKRESKLLGLTLRFLTFLS